jgi:hypothetical protein
VTSAALSLALLAGGVWAHEPHDPTYWVATAPGEEAGWLVVMLVEEPKQAALLVRTQDRLTMETRYLTDGTWAATSAAMLGPERLVVGTDMQGLWVSDDVGDSFEVHPDLPPDATVNQVVASPEVLDTGLALAVGTTRTPEGLVVGNLWRSEDAGETWREVMSVQGRELLDVSLAPDWDFSGRAVASSPDGGLWLSIDRGVSWAALGELGQPVYQVAAGEGARLWAGSVADGLWLSQDDGASFERVAFAGEPITAVADLGGGLIMATQPELAVFVSRDGGASFDLSRLGLDPVESGQPMNGVHHYRLQRGGDGAIYLAAWEGVAWTEDQGMSWQTMESTPPWVQRGVELSIDAYGDPAVIAGTYGGGVELVTPGTGRAMTLGSGLFGGFIKRIAVTDDYGRDSTAYVNLLRLVQETEDHGDSWPLWADDRLGDIADVAVSGDWTERAFVIAAGNVDDGGGWCWALDRGEPECWVPLSGEQVCKAVAVSPGFAEDGMAWAACGADGIVFGTDDFAGSWTQLAQLDAHVFDISATAGGQALFVATSEGLYRAWQGGALEPIEPQGEPVWAIEAATVDDAVHLVALVPLQGWLFSDDGGERFEALPRPTEDLGLDLALSPNYASDGGLVVGSFDGTWYSQDRGQSWEDVHVVETLEHDNPLWEIDPAWSTLHDDEAHYHQRAVTTEPGARASLRFRGVGLDLLAPTWPEGGLLSLTLDGEDQGEVSLAGEEAHQQVVARLMDLQDGWHRLELTAIEGEVSYDAARVWRQPGFSADGPGDSEDSGDTGLGPTGRCGGRCSGTGGTDALLLAPWLAGLLVLRRRSGWLPGATAANDPSPLPRAEP